MTSRVRLAALIIALLACNTAYYIVAGRLSEALESVAWYALLILFMLETMHGPHALSARALAVNHGLRLLATMAIAASAVLYVREKEWLDAINLFLWITVVALLEIEIRFSAAVAAHRKFFTRSAALLYATLGVLVFVWLDSGKWMNAWDATLWLTAFGLLELDLMQKSNNIV